LKIYLKFLFRVEKLSGWANFSLGKSRRRDSRRNRAARFIHKAIFDSEVKFFAIATPANPYAIWVWRVVTILQLLVEKHLATRKFD